MRCPTRLFDKSSRLEGSISRVEAVEVAFLQARVLPPVARGLVFLRALRRIPPVCRHGSLRFPRNSGRTTIPGAEPRASLRSFRRASFEAHSGPSAVLVDEFDARSSQGAAYGLKGRATRLRSRSFSKWRIVMMPTPARSARFCWLQLSKPRAALHLGGCDHFLLHQQLDDFLQIRRKLLTSSNDKYYRV